MRLTDEEVAALPSWTRELLDVLTDQERFALVKHEGGSTYDEIGAQFGVSGTRAGQAVPQAPTTSSETCLAVSLGLMHADGPLPRESPRSHVPVGLP